LVFLTAPPMTNRQFAMQPDDIFAVFSDGVTEPENESGEFGEERLIELIQEHRNEPLSRIGDVITSAVADWIGDANNPMM